MRQAQGGFSIRAQVLMENGASELAVVTVQDGRITQIRSDHSDASLDKNQEAPLIDAPDAILLPGFIDVHVHGGVGYEFMDATQQAFDEITRFHSTQGTTTMLATTVTASKESLDAVLAEAARYQQGGMPYARIHGVHLEGPFLNPQWAGAQNPAYLIDPQQSWFDLWLEQYPNLIQIVTLAPELTGAIELIRKLDQQGIICACGHTNATYEEIAHAADHGLRHAVHTFNAMTGLHHRNPGTVGAVLTDERIIAEVIADGHHVHPACIELLIKAKQKHNMLLITDAIAAAGLNDGSYSLGGLEVVVTEGVARLKHGGNLAGSTLTMIEAIRYMVQTVGLTLAEASRLASYNPAKQLNILHETGSIAIGKKADLVLVTPELQIKQVWVEGKVIF